MDFSVIAFGRNDNYKSSGKTTFAERLSLFVESLRSSLEGVDWELSLVDYNPLPGCQSLFKLIDFSRINLNGVTVSESEWQRFMNNHKKAKARFDRVPVYPTHAVNAGLKKSSGKFVLFTSTDNIFPVGLAQIVKNAQDDVFYRACRGNIEEGYAVKNFKNILKDKWEPDIFRRRLWKACGDFMLLSREHCLEIGGYLPIAHPRPYGADAQLMFFAKSMGLRIEMLLDYRFANINILSGNEKKSSQANYVCKHYNHQRWLKNKEFKAFKKWAYIYPFHHRKESGFATGEDHVVNYNFRSLRDWFLSIGV